MSFHGLLHEVFLASTSVLMFIPHSSISFGIASRLNICSSKRSSLSLIHIFHQEIYAHLIIYNFSEMITSHVAISKKKRLYTYKANFSVAVHVCRLFFYEKATSPGLEAIISKNLIPIRPDRHYTRKRSEKGFCGFLYRVA